MPWSKDESTPNPKNKCNKEDLVEQDYSSYLIHYKDSKQCTITFRR